MLRLSLPQEFREEVAADEGNKIARDGRAGGGCGGGDFGYCLSS